MKLGMGVLRFGAFMRRVSMILMVQIVVVAQMLPVSARKVQRSTLTPTAQTTKNPSVRAVQQVGSVQGVIPFDNSLTQAPRQVSQDQQQQPSPGFWGRVGNLFWGSKTPSTAAPVAATPSPQAVRPPMSSQIPQQQAVEPDPDLLPLFTQSQSRAEVSSTQPASAAASSSAQPVSQGWWGSVKNAASRVKGLFTSQPTIQQPVQQGQAGAPLTPEQVIAVRTTRDIREQIASNQAAAEASEASAAVHKASTKDLLKNEGIWATIFGSKWGIPGEITVKTGLKYAGIAALAAAVAWVFADNGIPVASQLTGLLSVAIPSASAAVLTYFQICIARDLQDIERKSAILLNKANDVVQSSEETVIPDQADEIFRQLAEASRENTATRQAMDEAIKKLTESRKEVLFRAEASQTIAIKIFGYPILEVQAPLSIATAVHTVGIHAGLLFLCLAVSKGALPIPTDVPKYLADQYLENASRISSLMIVYSSLVALHDINKYSTEVKSWLETNGPWLAAAMKATAAIAGVGAVAGFAYWISKYLQGIEANNVFDEAIESGIKDATAAVVNGDTIVRGGAAFACVFVAAGITLYPQVFEALPFTIETESKVEPIVTPAASAAAQSVQAAPAPVQPQKSWWQFWR